jgi:hypothetical protein
MATLDANGPVQLQMNPIFTGVPDAAPPADVVDDPDVAADAADDAADVAAADVADDAEAAAVVAADVAADDPPELSLPQPAATATTPTVTNATTQPRRAIGSSPSIRTGPHPSRLTPNNNNDKPTCPPR